MFVNLFESLQGCQHIYIDKANINDNGISALRARSLVGGLLTPHSIDTVGVDTDPYPYPRILSLLSLGLRARSLVGGLLTLPLPKPNPYPYPYLLTFDPCPYP